MKTLLQLFLTGVLIMQSVCCVSQSYFVPTYGDFDMLDHNPQWILRYKVKAIQFREYLMGSVRRKKNVTVRLLFDDSGRIARKFSNHGKNDSQELDDLDLPIHTNGKMVFCHQSAMTVRKPITHKKIPNNPIIRT